MGIENGIGIRNTEGSRGGLAIGITNKAVKILKIRSALDDSANPISDSHCEKAMLPLATHKGVVMQPLETRMVVIQRLILVEVP